MSSLNYSDEHLAWQQRVQKEINAAAGFISTFHPVSRKLKISDFNKKTSQLAESPQMFSKTLNFSRDLRHTNIHAEVRGKYARMPVLNPRSQSTKNNVYDSVFKNNTGPEERNSGRQRTRFLRLRSSGPERESVESIESDIKEITRLLKIERVKRMIMQKKLKIQESNDI